MANDSVEMIYVLLARLERISIDSYLAHRASGIRGALLRSIQRIESGQTYDEKQLNRLTEKGFELLARAAESM